MFQFRYGSIKTGVPALATVGATTFQFRYGSIKTLQSILLISFQISFNSDMVRLRPARPRPLIIASLCFNSDMVRLRQSIAFRTLTLSYQFQFRYGSIKTAILVLIGGYFL